MDQLLNVLMGRGRSEAVKRRGPVRQRPAMGQDLAALIVILIIPGVLCGSVAGVQECYICQPRGVLSVELLKQFPDELLPNCEVKADRKVCPSGSRGCLTQHDAFGVTKACSLLFVNDCRQANNVEYCYCRGTLCNVEEKAVTSTQETDDEDMSEGSGEGKTPPVTYKPKNMTTSTTTAKPLRTQHISACSIPKMPGLIFLVVISLFLCCQ